ncbi:MAG: hypothetical protein NWE75_01665, partial [Candidatus Bathyarchaeota archaeon]|nr:hypothetical protein [Candidatus Bathyarchaeota archaeon]
PYEVEVERWAIEPHEVQVPYQVNVSVIKSDPIYENDSVLEYNGLTTNDIELEEGTISIEWSSAKQLEYFTFMGAERWDIIWSDFQWKYGVVLSIVLMTGGILFPLAVYYFDRFIENCTEWVATPEDYYQQNSIQGSAIRDIIGGKYKIVVFNTQSSENETKNNFHVLISSLYNTTELQTFLRNETMYRNVTYSVNETRYRLEERVRYENRTIGRRLLELPELGVISWNTISAGTFILGIILFQMARKPKRVL